MSERVKVSIEGDVARVTLNRPDKHNGMDFEMLDAMLAAQRVVKRARQVRAVILQGEGPSFCAGLDFKSAMSRPAVFMLKVSQLLWPWMNHFQRWSMGWRQLPVPVIAVMHGNCFGAGLQLGLGADIRICHPDAKLSLLEAKWGLVPDMGGVCTLRELLPIDVVKELTYTGRIVDAAEALKLGLVTHVSADPQAHALALAQAIANRSPDSVAAGKLLLQGAWRVSDRAALRLERLWQRRVMGRRNQKIALAREAARAKAEAQGSEARLPAYQNRRI